MPIPAALTSRLCVGLRRHLSASAARLLLAAVGHRRSGLGMAAVRLYPPCLQKFVAMAGICRHVKPFGRYMPPPRSCRRAFPFLRLLPLTAASRRAAAASNAFSLCSPAGAFQVVVLYLTGSVPPFPLAGARAYGDMALFRLHYPRASVSACAATCLRL